MQTQQQFAPQQYASRAPPPSGFSSVPICETPVQEPLTSHRSGNTICTRASLPRAAWIRVPAAGICALVLRFLVVCAASLSLNSFVPSRSVHSQHGAAGCPSGVRPATAGSPSAAVRRLQPVSRERSQPGKPPRAPDEPSDSKNPKGGRGVNYLCPLWGEERNAECKSVGEVTVKQRALHTLRGDSMRCPESSSMTAGAFPMSH